MKVLENSKGLQNRSKPNGQPNYITNNVYKYVQKENKQYQSYQQESKHIVGSKNDQNQKLIINQDLKVINQKGLDQNKMSAEKVNKEIRESKKKKQLKSSILLDQEKYKLNQQLYQSRGKDILDFYLEQEHRFNQREFLKNHLVTEELRSKMLDWMVEVLGQYKCTDQTFFRCIHIMDQYFYSCKTEIINKDVHLLGIVSMFIGTKYEEIWPFRLKTVYEKIGHKKFSEFSIKELETQIMNSLDFKIDRFSVYDFVELFIQDLGQLNTKNMLQPKIIRQLDKVCVYLSKMVYYDYQILKTFQYSHIAIGIIYVAFKIVEQVNPNFQITYLTCHLKKFIKISEDDLFKVSTRMLNLAKNFDNFYKGLSNLKKFNGFQFEDNKNTSQQQ